MSSKMSVSILFVTVLFVLVELRSSFFVRPLGYASRSRDTSTLKMMATTDANGVMSFGSKIPMKVTLPTRDADQARTFISNLDSMVESTYEAGICFESPWMQSR